MKKYLLLLFLCASVYSQTISEKWNSMYNRYDYTDSNGNLVGYKGYNTLTESWEYTSVNSSRTNQNISYQQPINLQLLDRALASKQAQYDKRQIAYNKGFQIVKEMIEYCRKEIKQSYPEIQSLFSTRFENEVVKVINDKNYDYSRVDTKPITKWIADSYNYIGNDLTKNK
jgi:hypothetical protein